MPASSVFLAAAALSVGLQLRAEYRGPRWQVYLFKPSTTALLLLLAVVASFSCPRATASSDCFFTLVQSVENTL